MTRTNHFDWKRNLRIVLRQERKLHVIDVPCLGPLPEGATRVQQAAYQKYIDDDTDVTCLMLATMSPELQKQHEHMDARQERFDTSKTLYAWKQGDRDPVGPHVLKMIGYMEYLATLGSTIDKTPTELLAVLKTAETNIQKASLPPIMMVNKGSAKEKSK
ncbi:uncharacterized protein LOC141718413 [Apium graveolens]|uniref:uncharacterized protein LOC141718413 n=1 Tax=Apium graveolens TaxID=4045 RepID=UPI003D7BD9EF